MIQTSTYITLKQFVSIGIFLSVLLISSEVASASVRNNAPIFTADNKNDANTGEKEEVKPENSGDKKHAEVLSAQDSVSIKDGGMYLKQSTGNTDMNSLCKFNFIFYFIYKHKYSEEQTGNEYLDYEF